MTAFIEGRVSEHNRPHPTSGLPGFPARDYMATGGSTVHAPFDGVVPVFRPIGWAPTQNPAAGFGGQRVYLVTADTPAWKGLLRLIGRSPGTAYMAHFGELLVARGQAVRQGDPIGRVWAWPNDPGRSHIHFGYSGGDPISLVSATGELLLRPTDTGPGQPEPGIQPVAPRPQPGPSFPIPRLVEKAGRWIVTVGAEIVYSGTADKARAALERQRRARRINLHFKNTTWAGGASPLVGKGLAMVRAADRHQVDERLMAAIASCGTSGGTLGGGPKVNNFYGILVPGGAHREFPTIDAGLDYLASLLRREYLDKRLVTVAQIGGKWAPGAAGGDPDGSDNPWVVCVGGYYGRLGGDELHA